MILGLSFTKDSPRVDLADMPRGLDPGLTVRVAVRRLGTEPRQRILELGTATGARVILETGDRPDMLVLAQEQGGTRKELVARGVLPADRWVPIHVTMEPDGDAQIAVFGLTVARGNVGNPYGAARTENFLGRGSAGNAFVGELSQLHIWRSPSPDYLADGSPKLDSDKLWAAFALDRVATISETVNGVTTTYYRLQDAGKLAKHGRCSSELASVRCVEPLYDAQVRGIRLVNENEPAKLAPLAALDGGLTMEAWICPDELTKSRSVLRLAGGAPLALCVGGADAAVSLVGHTSPVFGLPSPINEEVVILSAANAVRSGVFTHIAATVRQTSTMQYVAALYVQGQLVAEGSWPLTVGSKQGLALQSLFAAQHLKPALGGTFPKPNRPGFLGTIAEARLWSRALAADELGGRWLTRARGDESGLRACYRLDEMAVGCSRDITAQRGIGTIPVGAVLATVSGLPLLPSQSSERARIVARGKLVRETLLTRIVDGPIVTIVTPTSSGPPLPPLPGTGEPELQLPRYRHQDAVVFDATLNALNATGDAQSGATIEVRIDTEMVCITSKLDDCQFARWKAGQTYQVTVPANGSLRLRFFADQLACPTLRVRLAGQQADLWTVVRPDEKTHRQLRTITGSELQKPVDKRTSPLPAGATAEDANALATICNQVGRVLPPFPQATVDRQASLPATLKYAQFKNFGNDFVNFVEDTTSNGVNAVNDFGNNVVDEFGNIIEVPGQVGSAIYNGAGQVLGTVSNGIISVTDEGARLAQRLPKTAGQLMSKAGAELDTLVSNARKTAARYGQSAISTFINSANSLSIPTQSVISDVVHAFEVVGTTLVNGVEGYFRIVVRGISEALAVLEAVLDRIGAVIEEVLRYLAYLFNWGAFLEASDDAIELLEAQISTLPSALNSLGDYKSKCVEYLNSKLDTSFLSKSLAELCGIRVDPDNPVMEDLDYVIEQVQRIQDYTSSLLVSTVGKVGGALGSSGFDQTTLNNQLTTSQGLLPCSALSNPANAIAVPINDLLKNAAGLAGSSGSIFDALFDSIVSNAQNTIDKGSEAARKRIDIGGITDFIEKVILDGRTFSALRIVALCAAIPKVLGDKIGESARSGILSPQALSRLALRTSSQSRSIVSVALASPRSDTGGNDEEEKPSVSEWDIWLPWSCSLIAAFFLLIDTVREFGESESPAKASGGAFLQIICGFFTVLKSLLQTKLVKLLPSAAQPYATTNCYMEATAGAWLMLSPILRNSQAFKGQSAFMNKFDMGIYGVLGVVQLILLVVPLSTKALTGKDAITATCLRGAAYLSGMVTRAFSVADNGDTTGSRKKTTMVFIVLTCALDLSDASYGQSVSTHG